MFCPTAVGTRGKGGILFPKRIPPLEPPEKGDGCSPRPPTLSVWCLNNYTRCALHSRWQLCCLTDVAYPLRVIRCGVRGFATSLCESVHSATAPYYREARVTVVGRQTAYGMRHYCARRIDETGGRRELLRTSTRWAERHPQGVCRIRKAAEPPTAAQQRMIEAAANRIATPNAATPRYGQCNRQALQLFELLACNGKRLSFGRSHRPFSFSGKKMGGVVLPPAGGISLRAMRGI